MEIRQVSIQLTVAIEDDSVAYDLDSNITDATDEDLTFLISKLKHVWYQRITRAIIDSYRKGD